MRKAINQKFVYVLNKIVRSNFKDFINPTETGYRTRCMGDKSSLRPLPLQNNTRSGYVYLIIFTELDFL
jgi:hypothetical protein